MATYDDLATAINSAVSSITQCTSDLQDVHQAATARLEEIVQAGGSGSGQQGATGETGADGKSAYELAVENGFEGTEQEWLASLKGSDGVIGSDGKSAYEIAVDNGFSGTEAQWLDSLHVTATGGVEVSLPIGTLIAYSGVNNPAGWLECDGSAVSRTTYSELFQVIGTTYGEGDGETTFNLPDYRNRFIQGSLEAGTEKDAGLPDITGTINGLKTVLAKDGTANASTATGAFTKSITAEGEKYSSTLAQANVNFSFSASSSNAIYGGSDTVQPPALTARILIKAESGLMVNDEYSTSETLTNKVWIDGKPIYRKVVTLEKASASQLASKVWTQLNLTGMPDYEAVTHSEVVWSNESGRTEANLGVAYHLNASGIYYYSNGTFSYTGLCVIMEYTKA